MSGMLKILLLSFIVSIVCGVITTGLSIFLNRKESCVRGSSRIIGGVVLFVVDLVWMILFLYCSCNSLTIITAIMYICPALATEALIMLLCWGMDENLENVKVELISTAILTAISFIFFISNAFTPAQNLTYAHDMENVDITYAISSDEILAKIELKLDSNFKEKYFIKSPEMRQVNGKNIAVYKVENYTVDNTTEYIPGYFIQEEGELPKLVTKRIYYDISYYNKKDALRTIRRKYPTAILGDHKFDIDDNWNPYEVYVYRDKMYSSNGEDYGLIILNLKDGTSEKYPVSEGKLPSWIDFETNYPR